MDSQRRQSVLIYQAPSQPCAARAGVWRELKRLGALYRPVSRRRASSGKEHATHE